jgi:predicted secreted protein
MVVTLGGTDLSGQGRSLEVSQSVEEIDVTTYGSPGREFIVTLPERSASLEVLDDATSATIRDKTKPGSGGTLVWFPQGTASGKPKFTCGTTWVTEQNLSYPYDDAVTASVSLRLSGAVTEGTAP